MAHAELMELVRSTGRLNPEQWHNWEQWCDLLAPERRAELLDLQTLLSCLVAFGYFENHRPEEHVTNFRPHLEVLRETMRAALSLAQSLRRRGDSQQRLRAVCDGVHPEDTPEEAIATLETSLSDAFRVLDPFCRSDVVSIDSFHACCDLISRDLDRNPFFFPLAPLEFSSLEVSSAHRERLDKVDAIELAGVRTVVTLSMLGLLRLLRYSALARRLDAQHVHVIFAGLRRNVRALARFLSTQAAESIAKGVVPVSSVGVGSAKELDAVQYKVQSIAIALREDGEEALGLAPSVSSSQSVPQSAYESIITAVQDAVTNLEHAIVPAIQPARTNGASAIELGRFRLYAWMLQHVMRAFVAKASAVAFNPAGAKDLGFVSEFLQHLKSLGRTVVEEIPYDRKRELVVQLKRLKSAQPVDLAVLKTASHECSLFADHIEWTVRRMDERDDLPPFDKGAAARRFRRYLTSAQASRQEPELKRAPTQAPDRLAGESRTHPESL